nr:acyl-CoA dehydrogenase family protein [Moorella sulfitireducens]
MGEGTSQRLQQVKKSVERFVAGAVEPLAAEIRETGIIPDSVIAGARELGLFGMIIPNGYGGLDLDVAGACTLLEVVGHSCPGLACLLGVHNCLAVAIGLLGTGAQKAKYLPDLASGGLIGGYALPFGDWSGWPAVTVVEEEKNERHVLNGVVRWVANGPVADLVGVVARAPARAGGLPLFYAVEKDYRTCTVGAIKKLGGLEGFAVSEMVLEEYEVGDGVLQGCQEGLVKEVLYEILNICMVGLAACWLGAVKRVVKICLAAASQGDGKMSGAGRRARLNVLSKVHVETEALAGMVTEVARKLNRGEGAGWEGLAARVKASEVFIEVTRQAAELLAGIEGKEGDILASLRRDADAAAIVGGGNELIRQVIGKLIAGKG